MNGAKSLDRYHRASSFKLFNQPRFSLLLSHRPYRQPRQAAPPILNDSRRQPSTAAALQFRIHGDVRGSDATELRFILDTIELKSLRGRERCHWRGARDASVGVVARATPGLGFSGTERDGGRRAAQLGAAGQWQGGVRRRRTPRALTFIGLSTFVENGISDFPQTLLVRARSPPTSARRKPLSTTQHASGTASCSPAEAPRIRMSSFRSSRIVGARAAAFRSVIEALGKDEVRKWLGAVKRGDEAE
ncbi:hypothetical protein EDB87DRAFT_1828084 [Lactarius vividus]|nr:hypothetical protein EDB87DRAFT_1828084 [Lactarius vividus]